jgi:transposase
MLFTCFVNREGVPLMGTVADGNRSDQRLNRDQIARIVRAFSPEALRDLVSIADSALVTGPTLYALAAADLA